MPTLIAVLLVILAVVVLVAFAKFVAGLIILALGVVAGLYLWNRHVKQHVERSGSGTPSPT